MKIETERTIIRLPKESDFDFVKSMWLDGEVMKYVGFPKGLKISDNEIMDWIHNEDKPKIRLVIENKDTGKPIGETGWQLSSKYPHANGRKAASLEIKIGDKDYWGKGLATEALKALLGYIFQNTDIEVCYTEPNLKNIAALKLYKKLGFKKVGKPGIYTEGVQIPVHYQYMEIEKS